MATRFSTLRFDLPTPLRGCGIDAEEIGRFDRIADEGGLPFVFTERELAHCRGLTYPAQGLCAAFCCKEALRKALGTPYNLNECTALLDEGTLTVDLRVADSVKEENSFAEIRAEIKRNTVDEKELVAVVVIRGEEKKRISNID